MATLAVTKMHGALNDFIVLDGRRSHDTLDYTALARRLCDRRAGIGADGLLLIEEAASANARMRIYNADGSEAEMCGNGIRCVVRFLDEEERAELFQIETLAGMVSACVMKRVPDYLVRVDVGRPIFEERVLPFADAQFVSLGNPHAVVFTNGALPDGIVALGRQMPGANVHAVHVRGEAAIDVQHHERGAGATMACGTGAVAAAAAAIRRGLVRSPVDVRVPGGDLRVEWDGHGHAFLTGPAERVFDARVDT